MVTQNKFFILLQLYPTVALLQCRSFNRLDLRRRRGNTGCFYFRHLPLEHCRSFPLKVVSAWIGRHQLFQQQLDPQMANLQFVFLAVAVSLFFYTTNASEAQDFVKIKPNKVRSGGANFEYDDKSTNGPKSWGKIDPEFEMCGLGQHQSPINLIIKNSTTEGMMPEVELFESVLQYRPSGNNYVLNCRGGPGTKYCTTVTYYKERYHMLQAHFHSPSEHLIDGKSYPLGK